MVSTKIRVLAGVLLIGFFLPNFAIFHNQNLSNSATVITPIGDKFDKITDFTPRNAADITNITFANGVRIFQGPSLTATINWIIPYDFTKNTTINGGGHEAFDDLILGDSEGNVFARQNIYEIPNFNSPFKAWKNSTASWNVDLTLANPGENISFVTLSAISQTEYQKMSIFAMTRGGTALHYYYNLGLNALPGGAGGAYGYNLHYFKATQWSAYNRTAPASNITGYLVNSIIQCDFVQPFVNSEYVVGLNNGEIFYLILEDIDLLTTDGKMVEHQVGTMTGQVLSVQTADLDLDGCSDILALDSNGNINAFFGRPGFTNWSDIANIDTGTDIINFAVDDLNSDGFPDIIGYNASGQIRVWLNDGTPRNGISSKYAKNSFFSQINQIKLADLDLDNDLDIIVALENGSIGILENHQNHNPTIPPSLIRSMNQNSELNFKILSTSGTPAANCLLIHDIDDDSYPDIISGHKNGLIYAWKNTPPEKENQFKIGREVRLIDEFSTKRLHDYVFGDLDRDGDEDILAAYNADGAGISILFYFENPGTKNFYLNQFSRYQIFTQIGNFEQIMLYDIDRDGDLDIVYLLLKTDGKYEVRVVKNIYNATNNIKFQEIDFSTQDTLLVNCLEPGKIYIDDFLGDGSPEILIAGYSGNITIYPHFEQSQFTPYQSIYWNSGRFGVWEQTELLNYAVSNLEFADHEKFFSPVPNNPFAPVLRDKDITFASANGSVYYAPQIYDKIYSGIKPSVKIFDNNSIAIDKVFFVEEKFSRRPAIIFGGNINGSKGFFGSLSRNNISYYSWIYFSRLYLDFKIWNINSMDMNKDGINDFIFNDENNTIYVAKGKNTYITQTTSGGTQNFEIEQICNFTQHISQIKLFDLDGDGDKDIIIHSSDGANDTVWFLKNALDDIISSDFIHVTINPTISATSVLIEMIVNPDRFLQSTPVLKIIYDADNSVEYISMSILIPQQQYKANYNLKGNGTYIVQTNGTDQWNNLAEYNGVFFGDFIPPVLTHLIKNYRNGYFELFIYNSTSEEVFNKQIGLNITLPESLVEKTYYFNTRTDLSFDPNNAISNILYYMGNNTWWIRFTRCQLSGSYKIGINATDAVNPNENFDRIYRHIIITTNIDNELPLIDFTWSDMLPKAIVNIPNNFDISLNLKFSEPLMYMKYWVEDGTGTNVLKTPDNEPTIEIYDVGQTYNSSFQTFSSGNLNIKFLIQDTSGNINYQTYSFFFTPQKIGVTKYLESKSTGPLNNITYQPSIWLHFGGTNITEFRVKYDSGANVSVGGAWSEWMPYSRARYYGNFPEDGYRIYFLEKQYGIKNVEVQVRNNAEIISLGRITVEYTTEPKEEFNFIEWIKLPAIIGVGLLVIGLIARSAIKNGEWKKYATQSDGDEI
jgi:hypothetical protein